MLSDHIFLDEIHRVFSIESIAFENKISIGQNDNQFRIIVGTGQRSKFWSIFM